MSKAVAVPLVGSSPHAVPCPSTCPFASRLASGRPGKHTKSRVTHINRH